MSSVNVITSLSTLDEPHPSADLDLFVSGTEDEPGLSILSFFSPYSDMLISPQMLNAFENELNQLSDRIVIRVDGRKVDNPLEHMQVVVGLARAAQAYIIILGA